MANQWALLIGINHYSTRQPLLYAQADAVGLRNFFVQEAGLPPDQCLLLCDRSVSMEPQAHYPLGDTLRTRLQQLCQRDLQPNDTLWVFFSGYGCHNAGQDYLLPIDGDPDQLETTAIPLRWILETLKTAPTEQRLLVLDMNRSQGVTGGEALGQQTLALAKEFEIPTLLSCQPEQYSHETMAVRHGLFTQALLEGMRYHGCVTVGQLVDYCRDRVPELSQHHWRPEQNPVAGIPPQHKFMLVIPKAAIAALPLTERAAAEVATLPMVSPTYQGVEAPETVPALAPADPAPASKDSLWAKIPPTWRPWGIAGGAIALFLLALSLRQLPWPIRLSGSPPMPPGESLPPPEPGSPPQIWAEAAIAQGRYSEARAWLALVPPEAQDDAYQALWAEANGPAAQAAEQAQAQLAAAQERLQPVSASLLNEAIETARQIPPDSPLYEEAQAAILRWGSLILDLAEGRAATGDITGAIAAAQLVPLDNPSHGRAQAHLQRWQQEQANREAIQSAQSTLEPGQASSLQRAIVQVQETITPNQPGYALAQERIEQWSAEMLTIARARAAQGRYGDAIAAAQLIPPRTAAYGQAQEEIQRWQAAPPPPPPLPEFPPAPDPGE